VPANKGERLTGDTTLYLRVLARVRPDNVVRRIRTQLTERPGRADADREHPAAWGELLADDGRLLLRWPVAGGGECDMRPEQRADLLLRAHVPIAPAARGIRIVRDGVAVIELRIAEESPAAELRWAPGKGGVVKGRRKVSWRTRAEGAEAFLRYSTDDGRTWMRIGARSTERPFAVDFDELPGGARCRLALVVTAGCRTTIVVSGRFRVAGRPPDVIIVSPPDGAVISATSSVRLEAAVARPFATPTDGRLPVISWHSIRDGALGEGAVASARLRPGTHRLTARLAGRSAEARTVTVTVR
jgi:hypothetical protein